MLSYSVGRDRTILFVVQPQTSSPSGIAALTVPVGAESLRERVGAFRNLIDRASGAESPGTQTLDLQSRQLFDLLVEPARHLIGGARRLVISPDGPLHLLPFAALRLPASDALPTLAPRYLIEWKPIHTVVSATVYAELQKARRPAHSAAGGRLVAFGDPRYPPVSPDAPGEANPMARDTERSGFALEPLPASRIEVGAIARLYGARAVSYVGKAATEERAKSLDRTTRYLHFATHGILDSRFPLNSALVFSIDGAPAEGKENGLLQAWEVFEQVRFDADLVTLSACDSGLGRELGGEGLVGLTRAFQYAGARSVLASLWRIGDESTADLMTRFYRNLRAGQTKDVALRGAQLDLIRSARTGTTGDRSHPFHWAAFTLTGDWR
jgi:CHAT domain-containing protein